MTKTEFLIALEAKLGVLPAAEIEKSTSYYSEIIDDMTEDGLSEEEATASLEDVDAVAQKIIYDTPLPVLIKSRFKFKKSTLNKILLIAGSPIWAVLLLVFCILVLVFYIVIWTLIFVLYIVDFSFALSGVVAILGSPFYFSNPYSGAFLLGSGFVLAALSVFAFPLAVNCSKWLVEFTVYISKKIKSFFIRKEIKENV